MTEVTVLMTVYNGMPHLPHAVHSICAQTLQDWRFVIVNDGSTDGTREYLDSIQDERFVILHQDNRGTGAAANRGLQECRTRYVARVDADDISLPTRLERQIAFLGSHPEVGLVGTQVAPLGAAGAGPSLHLPVEHDAIMTDLLAGRHGLAHSSVMMRTTLLKQVGGYWTLPQFDDWDMKLRMGEIARLANLDEVLHHYRIHSASLNGTAMRRVRWSIDYACELARRRHLDCPPISYEQFEADRNARPLIEKIGEAVELHARVQYRVALAEMYGHRPWKGRARMAWACVCSPRLSIQRLVRTIRHHRKLPQRTDPPSNVPRQLSSNGRARDPIAKEVSA